ncbi:hypothetical protein LINGRAHAP2_LOCUS25402 [Linum grandiflorum]
MILLRSSRLESSFWVVNRCVLQTFRRFLHLDPKGRSVTATSWWLQAQKAWISWRLQRTWSCFWRISLAVAGEEATIVVTWPSLRLIKGPWILASWVRDWWGLSPRLWRLPMIGSREGPGGSLV